MKYQWLPLAALLLVACGQGEGAEGSSLGESQQALSRSRDFDVDFVDCAEYVGIGQVPAANARPLVPAAFELLGDAQNAVVVVRVAECANVVVDGHAQGHTLTSQIGISLAGADTTAQINNYLLYYTTTSPLLKARLVSAGLSADSAKALELSLANGALHVASSSPRTPSFEVTGSAAVGPGPATSFTASWWGVGKHGTVRQRTVLPEIVFGAAQTTLKTEACDALARLAGSTTLTFPLLDSYNVFANAHLEVRKVD